MRINCKKAILFVGNNKFRQCFRYFKSTWCLMKPGNLLIPFDQLLMQIHMNWKVMGVTSVIKISPYYSKLLSLKKKLPFHIFTLPIFPTWLQPYVNEHFPENFAGYHCSGLVVVERWLVGWMVMGQVKAAAAQKANSTQLRTTIVFGSWKCLESRGPGLLLAPIISSSSREIWRFVVPTFCERWRW